MLVKIGKSLDNDYIVDDQYVSRHHAILKTTSGGEHFLEDLESGNGTYVNGQKIYRKKLISTDIISLGGQYSVTLAEILSSRNDYSTEFASLKEVYNNYQSQKVKIQSSNQLKTRLLQALPFTLPGIFGICLGISGIADSKIFYISLAIAIAAPITGIILGAKQAAKTPAQLQNLSDQFKIDYICPRCKTFLGEIPWLSLKNKGYCSNPSCKARW